MAVTHGMNVEEVRRLGAVLQATSGDIDGLLRDLDRLVASTTWVGPTADRFKHQWWPSNRAHLLQLSEDISGLGRAAVNNAEDQDRASASGTSTGSTRSSSPSSRSFLNWVSNNDVVGGLGILQSIAGIGDDVKAAYYATMIGLTSAGMSLNRGTKAFDYFRSAKGGFTTQYRKLGGKSGAIVSGVLNTTDYALNVYQNGWGSSEAASSAFEGTLSTGASLVPGGGIAFEGGMVIGDLLYEYTPIGDSLENAVVGGFEQDLDSLDAASDRALAAGDFEESVRLNQLASDTQARMQSDTSGYKGLMNSVGALFKPVFGKFSIL